MRRRPSIERTNIGQPCSIEGCRGIQTFSDRDVCRAHAVEEDERRAGEDLVARVAALAGRTAEQAARERVADEAPRSIDHHGPGAEYHEALPGEWCDSCGGQFRPGELGLLICPCGLTRE